MSPILQVNESICLNPVMQQSINTQIEGCQYNRPYRIWQDKPQKDVSPKTDIHWFIFRQNTADDKKQWNMNEINNATNFRHVTILYTIIDYMPGNHQINSKSFKAIKPWISFHFYRLIHLNTSKE